MRDVCNVHVFIIVIDSGMTTERYDNIYTAGLGVVKLFSCSVLLGMKFKLLINTEIAKINGKFRF